MTIFKGLKLIFFIGISVIVLKNYLKWRSNDGRKGCFKNDLPFYSLNKGAKHLSNVGLHFFKLYTNRNRGQSVNSELYPPFVRGLNSSLTGKNEDTTTLFFCVVWQSRTVVSWLGFLSVTL